MADDKEVEVTLDDTFVRLHRSMRELNFHASAAAGAGQGLEECLGASDQGDLSDAEAAPEIAMWARRVSSTHEAVSELAHAVSVEANILAAFFQPVDPASGN